jgi:hypothetical protein
MPRTPRIAVEPQGDSRIANAQENSPPVNLLRTRDRNRLARRAWF